MEVDSTRMCEMLVGLGDVDLVDVEEGGEGEPLVVVIRSRAVRPVCGGCGSGVWSKGYRRVVLVDLRRLGGRFGCGGGSGGGCARTLIVGWVVRGTGFLGWSGAGVADIESGSLGDYPGRAAGAVG